MEIADNLFVNSCNFIFRGLRNDLSKCDQNLIDSFFIIDLILCQFLQKSIENNNAILLFEHIRSNLWCNSGYNSCLSNRYLCLLLFSLIYNTEYLILKFEFLGLISQDLLQSLNQKISFFILVQGNEVMKFLEELLVQGLNHVDWLEGLLQGNIEDFRGKAPDFGIFMREIPINYSQESLSQVSE